MDSNLRYLSPYCLTLNVLVSFAQFEREVTGERIRDKISASKKKGMWMGGVVPLGNRAEDRALHVVEDHAAIVRSLFAARPPRPRGRGRATPSRRGARPGASGGAQAGRAPPGRRGGDRAPDAVQPGSRARGPRRGVWRERQDCSVTSRKVAGSSIPTAFDSPRPSLEAKSGDHHPTWTNASSL